MGSKTSKYANKNAKIESNEQFRTFSTNPMELRNVFKYPYLKTGRKDRHYVNLIKLTSKAFQCQPNFPSRQLFRV